MHTANLETVEESFSADNPSINGRYNRFNKILGGPFKSVWPAYDTIDQIDVAWHEIDLSTIDEQQQTKLFKEFELFKTINHPNILQISNQWVDKRMNKFCYITHITFCTLRSYFRHRVIHLPRIKQILKQILQPILYLHSKNVIYRNLTCDNIIYYNSVGRVLLFELQSSTLHSQMSIIRCPYYMAPELFQETCNYNEKIDIWSFGMCVLELITSSTPYSECKNSIEIYKRILEKKKPESLQTVHPTIRSFIDICINFEAKMRPTVKELLDHPFFYDTVLPLLPTPIIRKPRKSRKESVIVKHAVANNDGTIRIELKIVSDRMNKPMNVEFVYNHQKERPLSVAKEMRDELELPSSLTKKIETAIKSAFDRALK